MAADPSSRFGPESTVSECRNGRYGTKSGGHGSEVGAYGRGELVRPLQVRVVRAAVDRDDRPVRDLLCQLGRHPDVIVGVEGADDREHRDGDRARARTYVIDRPGQDGVVTADVIAQRLAHHLLDVADDLWVHV